MARGSQLGIASIAVLLAPAAAVPAQPAGAAKSAGRPGAGAGIVFTQLPRTAPLREGFGEGARIARLLPDGSLRVLSRGFHSAADPEVSFDGRRILFSGKRAADDRWQIYEMAADGTGLRQVTRESMHCRSPLYQSQTYTLSVDRPWHQIAFTGVRPDGSSLYSVKLDGSALRRLTYNPFGDADPFLAPDGRILFSGGQEGRFSIFGVNLDGTDFALFSGPEGGLFKRAPCVTTGRLALFVEPPGRDEVAGTLAVVNLRRNLHSYRRLTEPREGRFFSPAPAPDGRVLVSRIRAGGTYGIWRFDPETRRAEPLYDDPQFHDVQARLLAPRPEPDGRASVVDESESTGVLYCLSVYTSDLRPEWMPPGTAKRVRVLEAVGPKREARFLGEMALEEDGSFNLRTPANIPIRVQVLDADGMALRSSAWVWNRNKENRGCIGCHEDGELVPENRFARALAREPVPLTLPEERRRRVDFLLDVQPVLEAKCAASGCHTGTRSLNLAALVTPEAARTSPLVWHLFGRNTSRPWDRVTAPARISPMPPPGSPGLTQDEKRAIVEWIDLGAHVRGGRP